VSDQRILRPSAQQVEQGHHDFAEKGQHFTDTGLNPKRSIPNAMQPR